MAQYECDYCERDDRPDFDHIIDETGTLKSICPTCVALRKTEVICTSHWMLQDVGQKNRCVLCPKKLNEVSK